MNIGLVVARYQEDLSWINELQEINSDLNVYIYNKHPSPIHHVKGPYRYEYRGGIGGNEAETYLYHIERQSDGEDSWYKAIDTLDDVTLFVQGNPFDHVRKQQLIDIISGAIQVKDFTWLAYHILDCKVANDCHHRDLPISEFYTDLLGGSIAGDFNFGVGGQFAVSKNLILSNNPSRYIQARELILGKFLFNEPWCILERLWDQVFDKT
jgi:uncharacterized protein DUF3431